MLLADNFGDFCSKILNFYVESAKLSTVMIPISTQENLKKFNKRPLLRFQTAQKNSASLRSSARQFENSVTSYRALSLNNARLSMFQLFIKVKQFFECWCGK